MTCLWTPLTATVQIMPNGQSMNWPFARGNGQNLKWPFQIGIATKEALTQYNIDTI